MTSRVIVTGDLKVTIMIVYDNLCDSYGILWYSYGILWYLMVFDGIWWYFMVFYDILWDSYGIVWDSYGVLWDSYGVLWDSYGIERRHNSLWWTFQTTIFVYLERWESHLSKYTKIVTWHVHHIELWRRLPHTPRVPCLWAPDTVSDPGGAGTLVCFAWDTLVGFADPSAGHRVAGGVPYWKPSSRQAGR